MEKTRASAEEKLFYINLFIVLEISGGRGLL
jgi:hypothetical protein